MADETRLLWVDPGGGVRTSVLRPYRVFRIAAVGRELSDSEELHAFIRTLDPEEAIVLEVEHPAELDVDAVVDLARAHSRDVLVKATGDEP